MVLNRLRDRLKTESNEPENDWLEIDESQIADQPQKINVRIATLNDYFDTNKVQDYLRDGNVVFLRIKDLRNKNLNELKRSVEKIKKTVTAMNGDLVGLDEDYLIISPSFAQVYR